ncbi:hypothetical protein AVEN_71877-1 [Araneus ventricosus]|uniref:Uncharacterized protein n=1 Tax=Araneus ventricosus TaxID=182803 RepID=A0A4Y2RY94_ARAVE|nr:hypothetical protein AVEN_71877-1 [Araneus ventricosus]
MQLQLHDSGPIVVFDATKKKKNEITYYTGYINENCRNHPKNRGTVFLFCLVIYTEGSLELLLKGWQRIDDINHLKQRITDVVHSVTPDVLTRVWDELDYRLNVCRATNGAHIEPR